MSRTPHIGIVVGSTREGRFSERAAAWFHTIAARRTDVSVEIIDLRDYPMPFFDEPASPAWVPPKDQAAVRWAAKLAELDGFVFVTPEYNHGPSAALKNAIDFLYREWNNKSVGFVGYGGNGGARSVEILRQVVSNVELADVRAQVGLSLFTDFENFTTFQPGTHLEATVTGMLDQVIAWGAALKPLREAKSDHLR